MSFLTFEDCCTNKANPGQWTVRFTLTMQLLGWIEYAAMLRRYVFTTTGATFDATCLQEIALFLGAQNQRRSHTSSDLLGGST